MTRRLDPYAAGVLAVATSSLIVRLWLGLQFTWLDDDWTYVARSNTLPLPRFLLESYNGHVGPGQFLLVWLVDRIAPLSFGFATSVAAALGTAAILVWGAALRLVFGPRLFLLTPLALMALSPMTLWAGLWWASAVQAAPLQLATAGMVLFAARWSSGRARRDLVGVLATFVAGLLFWEKTLLSVVPVLAVVWMMTPGTAMQRLRAGSPALVALAATSIAYLAAYDVALRLYPGTWYAATEVEHDLGWPFAADVARGLAVSARDVLGPGVVGGPWELVPFGLTVTLPGPTGVGTAAALSLVLVLVVRGVRRRHGVVPVLAVLLYVGVALALANWSTTGALIGVDAMRNPRLVADPLVVTVLCVMLLVIRTEPEVRAGAPRDWVRGARSLPRAAAVPRVVLGLSVVGTAVVAAGLVVGVRGLWLETGSRAEIGWADNFRHDVSDGGSVLLADGRPPVDVYPSGFWPQEAWLSKMLAGVPGARFDGSGPTLSMVAPDGHVVPAAVERQVGTLEGPVDGCGYAIGSGSSIGLPLDGDLYAWNWGVEASFVAGADAEVTLEVDGTEIPMRVPAGVTTVSAPVNSAVSDARIAASETSPTVCLVGLSFGAVTPAR